MDTPSEIVHVPFNGQTIDAIAGEKPDAYFVALRPLCENLAVDYSSQRKRLSQQPWATMVMTTTVGADGKSREMVAIDRQTLVMWLATIDTSRLKSDQAKQVVTRYQLECASALDSYFSNGFAVTPAAAERIISDPDTFIRVLTELKNERRRADLLEAENERMLPAARQAEAFLDASGDYTVTQAAGLLSQVDRSMTRKRLFALLRADEMVEKRSCRATAKAVRRGYLRNVATTYADGDGGRRLRDPYAVVTPKGLDWMARTYCGAYQPRLPMVV